jgi:predicted small lipoprotein YifL
MKKIVFILLLLIIQSCGTSGSLYIPEEKYPLENNTPADQSRPQDEDYESSGTVDE